MRRSTAIWSLAVALTMASTVLAVGLSAREAKAGTISIYCFCKNRDTSGACKGQTTIWGGTARKIPTTWLVPATKLLTLGQMDELVTNVQVGTPITFDYQDFTSSNDDLCRSVCKKATNNQPNSTGMDFLVWEPNINGTDAKNPVGVCGYTRQDCSDSSKNASCKDYCYCQYPQNYSKTPTCSGETFNIGSYGDKTTCGIKCSAVGGNVGIKDVAHNDYTTYCDLPESKQCKEVADAKNVSPQCKYCFCKYPDNHQCKGMTTFLKVTAADDAACQANCAAAKLSGGKVYPKQSDECDFQYNESAKTCKIKPGNQNLTCARLQSAQDYYLGQGSPLSLPLPFSDITLPAVIGRFINNLLGIVGALALLFFIYGGVVWMTAAGNEKRIEAGRSTLVWAAVGLIAIFAAYAIVQFVLNTFAGAS